MLHKIISTSSLLTGNYTLSSIGNLCGTKAINAAIAPTAGQGVIAQLRNNLKQLDKLLADNNLSADNVIRTQIFTKNLTKAKEIETELAIYYGGKTPAFSIIPQPPAFGEDCLIEILISELTPKRINNNLSILEFEDMEWAFFSGITPRGGIVGPYAESVDVFQHANTLLEENGFSFGEVARTWIYQKDIITINGEVGENYQNMNNARADFFKSLSFKIGNPNSELWNEKVPPASTGIDMHDGSILLEGVAVRTKNKAVKGYPVSNPFQTNPFEYHQAVLQKAAEPGKKAPPAFSRGFSVVNPKGETEWISGTAAVTGEKVRYLGDTQRQTLLAIKNMQRVAEQRKMTLDQFFSTRAYIAKPKGYTQADFEEARDIAYDIVKKKFPNTPTIFVNANVCRVDWLFEIEAWVGSIN